MRAVRVRAATSPKFGRPRKILAFLRGFAEGYSRESTLKKVNGDGRNYETCKKTMYEEGQQIVPHDQAQG